MGLFDTLKGIVTKAGGQHEIDDFKAIIGKRGGLAPIHPPRVGDTRSHGGQPGGCGRLRA